MKVKQLTKTSIIPKRASKGAAGYDIFSDEDCSVVNSKLVSTGISIAIPEGYYGRVASRSGLACKNSIEVGAGVIDSDYRGELKVLLRNFSDTSFNIKKGDRIAQLILEKIITPEIEVVEDLNNTQRGDGGFGSTGV